MFAPGAPAIEVQQNSAGLIKGIIVALPISAVLWVGFVALIGTYF